MIWSEYVVDAEKKEKKKQQDWWIEKPAGLLMSRLISQAARTFIQAVS